MPSIACCKLGTDAALVLHVLFAFAHVIDFLVIVTVVFSYHILAWQK